MSNADNIFLSACGTVPTLKELFDHMACIPPRPDLKHPSTMEARCIEVNNTTDFFLPSQEQLIIALTIDDLMRRGYSRRNPCLPETWKMLYDEAKPMQKNGPSPAASVCGISGVGKTQTIERALRRYPQKTIHSLDSHLAHPLIKVQWLFVEVPASGGFHDFVDQLMLALDEAAGTRHFEHQVNARKPTASQRMAMWLRVAQAHFTGLLAIDEVQNFFKTPSKATRHASRHPAELRVKDDVLLKTVLNLTNVSGIPLLLSGTPDGIGALNLRSSTTQRLASGGAFTLRPFESSTNSFYSDHFFPHLYQYYWLPKKTKEFAPIKRCLIDLTGGIQRLMIQLWCHGQRHALMCGSETLSADHLQQAFSIYMQNLEGQIEAVKSESPAMLQRYLDLYSPHPR